MKIIEVRDGFIKFEADKSVYLSSFIQVDGTEKSYIAQINQIRNLGSVYMASAKILFLLNNGELKNYDKTLPPTDAEIKPFTQDILNNSIKAKKPVIIGKTPDGELNITIDSSAFDKKMLISVDTPELNNILVRNFTKQFENLHLNTVIIDTLGIIKAKKYTAGKDFKLPLNTRALNFMYESCLNDATAESKSTIVEIFKELAEYSQTVPFVPFETLKTIVDEMVDKQHVFKLLILKNKLEKFEKLGYFASKKEEADKLDNILQSKCAIIDLSPLNALFQNNYLEYLYDQFDNYKNIQVLLETSNTVSKKNLKKVLTESKIPTSVITHSKFKYLNDMKNLFDNFIIEPGIANNETFKVYSSFLASMKKNSYLITGEATNYIPLVSEAAIINDVIPYSEESAEQEEIVNEEPTEENFSTDTDIETEITEENFSETAEEDEDTEENLTEEDFEEINKDEFSEEESINITTEEEENSDESADSYYEQQQDFADDIIEHTNEEVMSMIEEKADNAIASVTENLTEPEELDLFSDNDDNNYEQEETIPQTDETITDEFTEQEIDYSEDNNDSIELNEDSESNAEEEFIEPSYSEITDEDATEPDSFSEQLENENADESDLNELNDESKIISEIEDDNLIQNEDSVLDELSNEQEFEEENFIESSDGNENIEISQDDLSEELLDTDTDAVDNDDIIINDESDETSIELDNDTNLLLEETEEQELEDNMPVSNIDVDLSEPQVLPLTGEALNHDFDEIVELDASESNEEDIVVDISDNDTDELDEEVEQQIMEDVDKVYTTMKNEDNLEEISDSDLDLIDELNNDGEELEEYTGDELQEISDGEVPDGIINEIHEYQPESDNKNDSGEILEKRESSTPIVPVYDADIPQEDMVMSDPIQQGDAVMHVKYGNGVVEKMIKYGSKTLFAINFENIGRRLLDPTLTEIKKV